MSNNVVEWKAKAAVAIMMNPMTGEILAMANRPTYNPNFAGKSPDYARRNRAITDLYEPGSTLKTILAAAALEEGVAGYNDVFDVSKGYIIVGGKLIRDTHKHKTITFKEIIQISSNVGAVQIGLKLGKKKYLQLLKKIWFWRKNRNRFPWRGERHSQENRRLVRHFAGSLINRTGNRSNAFTGFEGICSNCKRWGTGEAISCI